MNRPTRPTLADVAVRSGISKSTVSRVLNGHPYVSDDVREAVLRAVEELGYQTNDAARALRTRQTRMIGLVVATLRNEVFAAIAQGMDRVLTDLGRTLVVTTTDGRPSHEIEVIRSLLQRGIDGLVVSLADESSVVLRDLRDAAVPTVVLDREIKGGFADQILTNHRTAISDAVADLRGRGHVHIGLICPPLSIRPGREVRAAFVASAQPDPALVMDGPLTEDFGADATERLLAGDPRPSAIICGGTQVLVGSLGVLARANLRIPQDISMVAYDESDAGRVHNPPIAVIARQREEMGAMAAKLVMQRVEGTRTTPRREVVSARYVPRGSVADAAGRS
jgi:LacI family transcriptional regulator